MGARWYEADLDTFTARDTPDGQLRTPITLNRYTYAQDDPLEYHDPDGRKAKAACDAWCYLRKHFNPNGSLKKSFINARDAKNREKMEKEIKRLTRQIKNFPTARGARDHQIKNLKAERGAIENLLERNGKYLRFDPKMGTVVEVRGNLSKAKNVAILVPGVGTGIKGFSSGTGGRAEDLRVAAGGSTAVIAYQGYKTPSFGGTLAKWVAPFGGSIYDNAEAATPGLTKLIKNFTRGDQNVTAIGHSYGSLVVGLALKEDGGLRKRVDNFVAVGSPGVGVDHASELGPTKVWGERIVDDNVVGAAMEAPPARGLPSDPNFGAQRIHTSKPGFTVSGHGGYFEPYSQSMDNMGAIISGEDCASPRLRCQN